MSGVYECGGVCCERVSLVGLSIEQKIEKKRGRRTGERSSKRVKEGLCVYYVLLMWCTSTSRSRSSTQ